MDMCSCVITTLGRLAMGLGHFVLRFQGSKLSTDYPPPPLLAINLPVGVLGKGSCGKIKTQLSDLPHPLDFSPPLVGPQPPPQQLLSSK